MAFPDRKENSADRPDFWKNRVHGVKVIRPRFNRNSTSAPTYGQRGQIINLDQERLVILRPAKLTPVTTQSKDIITELKVINWRKDIDIKEMDDLAKVRHANKIATAKKFLLAGLLVGSVGTAVAPVVESAVSEVKSVPDSLTAYNQDSKDTNISGEKFVETFGKEFSGTKIGVTFIPEEYYLSLDNIHTTYGKKQMEHALNGLIQMHEQLGINDIRLGIRWDNVVDKNGNIDFSVYKPFFDYMTSHNMNIVFSFGIKTPGWGEDHEPDKVLLSLKEIPPDGSVIYPDSEFGQAALKYVDKLFTYLQKHYTKEQLARVTAFQPENEPFQSFGEHGWTMSEAYLTELIFKAVKVFPNAEIYINSAGFLNADQILDYYENLLTLYPNKFKNKLVLAIDDHPNADITVNDPLGGKIKIYNPPLVNQRIDEIVYAQVLGDKFEKIRERAEKLGVRIVMGEAGVGQWGTNKRITIEQFNLMILRQQREILIPGQDSIIYMYGLSGVLEYGSQDNKQIEYVMKMLNANYATKKVTSEMQSYSPSAFIKEISPFRRGIQIYPD